MQGIHDALRYKTQWRIAKYADDAAYARGEAYEESVIDGNLLLNAGITLLLQLGIGAGGTVFNNANARLGVGDSATAEAATQTGLVAPTNKLSIACSPTYPSVSGQTLTAQAAFGGAQANFAWNEFVLDNGTVALNRKVSAQGTKTAGQTWTLTLTITLS